MNRRVWCATSAALTLSLVLATPAGALSLEEAVSIAIRTHPTVAAAKDLQAAADAGVDQARAGFFPTIDLRVSEGPARTTNGTTRARSTRSPTSPQSDFFFRADSSLTISQSLFDGWSTRNSTDAARANLDAAGFRVLDAGELIGLRAVSSFLDVIRSRRLLDLARDNLVRHQDIADRILFQVDAGGASTADLDQAQARLSLAESTVTQFLGGLRSAEAGYLEAVGDLPETLEFPAAPTDFLPPSAEDAVIDLVFTNPSLQASRRSILAREEDVDAARASFLPRVSLELRGARGENAGGSKGPSNDFTALVILDYNLFRGGGDTARLRSAKALRSEARNREYEARRLIEQNTRLSFIAFEIARERLPLLLDQVEATESALAAYTEQFQLGQRTLLDILDMENEAFGARASLLNGRIDVLSFQYRILASVGRLLNTLGQTLEVAVRYDALDPATLAPTAAPPEPTQVAAAAPAAATTPEIRETEAPLRPLANAGADAVLRLEPAPALSPVPLFLADEARTGPQFDQAAAPDPGRVAEPVALAAADPSPGPVPLFLIIEAGRQSGAARATRTADGGAARDDATARPVGVVALRPPPRTVEEGVQAYLLRDYRTALETWRRLAERGNAEAQFYLGGLYRDGAGVERDFALAHAWWTLAGAQGHTRARQFLGQLVILMDAEEISRAKRLVQTI